MAAPGGEEPPDRTQLEPEPEGGPAERQRQFLEERLARLRPKEDAEGHGREAAERPETLPRTEEEGPPRPSSARGAGPETPPAPPENPRERALDEYRQRLREHR